MANALENWAYGVIAQYENRVANLLGFDLPYDVKVKSLPHDEYIARFGDTGQVGNWNYDDKTIYIDRQSASRNDPGFVVHELTHAFQGNSPRSANQTEGLADFVRYHFGLTTPGWTLRPSGQKWIDMTPEQRKSRAAAMSTVDGTDDVAPATADRRSGGPLEKIQAIAQDLFNSFNPGELQGDVGRRDLAYTMAGIYSTLIQGGASEESALKYLGRLALSRGGTTLFDPRDPEASLGAGAEQYAIKQAPKKGEGDGGGGDGGGATNDSGFTDEELAALGITGDSTTVEEKTKRDYLGSIVGSIPITGEIRQLALQAVKEQWSEAEWNYELSKTGTYQKDAQISYRSTLAQFGIDMTGNLRGLLGDAVASGYSNEEFLYYLRQTDEYRSRFRGIFKKNGDMRMSEGEYLAYEYNLETLGKQYGYKVDSQDVGESLRKGIMPEQFEDRLSALQRTREYEPALKAFQQTLKARGLLPKGAKDWTKQEQYEFVTGQSSPQFYRVWEEASARTAAYNAGIDIRDKGEGQGNVYTDVRRGALMDIIKSMPGFQTEEQLAEGFATIGKNLLEVLPLSEARTYGLTKQDIIRATMGGKNAARARQKVAKVLSTHEAFVEGQRAHTRFTQLEQGTGGDEQAQQSEY